MNRIKNIHFRSKRQLYEGVDSNPSLRFKLQGLKWVFWKVPHKILEIGLKSSGLFEKGFQNSLDLKLQHRVFEIEGLPEKLKGLKVLFLSDFHFREKDVVTDAIAEKIRNFKVDICLLGGDYQRERKKHLVPAINGIKKIKDAVEASLGFYAVLGNHDSIELVPELEKMGVRVLMNESVKLEKDSFPFYVVGVDDPFYFDFHDLEMAYSNVPENAFHIFLSHTPDLYKDASDKGANFYFCGHTHHGQIQFPLIGPLTLHSGAPRAFGMGEWQHEKMKGFTGPGVGTSGAQVRFGCPPEITIVEFGSSNQE